MKKLNHKKKNTKNKTKIYSNQKNVKSGVSALSSTSSSFGTAAASTRFDTHTNGIDDEIKAQALAEEEAAMNKYKVNYYFNYFSETNLFVYNMMNQYF